MVYDTSQESMNGNEITVIHSFEKRPIYIAQHRPEPPENVARGLRQSHSDRAAIDGVRALDQKPLVDQPRNF